MTSLFSARLLLVATVAASALAAPHLPRQTGVCDGSGTFGNSANFTLNAANVTDPVNYNAVGSPLAVTYVQNTASGVLESVLAVRVLRVWHRRDIDV